MEGIDNFINKIITIGNTSKAVIIPSNIVTLAKLKEGDLLKIQFEKMKKGGK